MIVDECRIFAGLFLSGFLAGGVITFLLALGGGSRAARAIFDFLTPLAVGAIYFFALYFAADGAFRVYSLIAFCFGIALWRVIFKKISPFLRRFARRIIVPIKSLEESLERRFGARLLPLRKRLDELRKSRREKREEKKKLSLQKKAALKAKRQEEEEGRRRERSKARQTKGSDKRSAREKSRPEKNASIRKKGGKDGGARHSGKVIDIARVSR